MNELVKVSYKFTEQIILTWHKAENSVLLTRSGDVKKTTTTTKTKTN